MNVENRAFLDWLTQWESDLPSLDLDTVITAPNRVALLVVDLIRGFCCEGPLASDRVADIVPAAARLLQRADDLGVRHFLLPQDAHDPNAVEFSAYPPHAIAGTPESETVDELKGLAVSKRFVVMPKNSISSDLGTDLDSWLQTHPEVNIFVVVGDCTDICVYQAAMHLRMRANVLEQRDLRVIVVADSVQTYDLPVNTAVELGALPHDGDLMHKVFLYHMALNGIEVVGHLE